MLVMMRLSLSRRHLSRPHVDEERRGGLARCKLTNHDDSITPKRNDGDGPLADDKAAAMLSDSRPPNGPEQMLGGRRVRVCRSARSACTPASREVHDAAARTGRRFTPHGVRAGTNPLDRFARRRRRQQNIRVSVQAFPFQQSCGTGAGGCGAELMDPGAELCKGWVTRGTSNLAGCAQKSDIEHLHFGFRETRSPGPSWPYWSPMTSTRKSRQAGEL